MVAWQTLKNEEEKKREASEAVLKHLWVLHAACAIILARWFTEKTEVSSEQAESVERGGGEGGGGGGGGGHIFQSFRLK